MQFDHPLQWLTESNFVKKHIEEDIFFITITNKTINTLISKFGFDKGG